MGFGPMCACANGFADRPFQPLRHLVEDQTCQRSSLDTYMIWIHTFSIELESSTEIESVPPPYRGGVLPIELTRQYFKERNKTKNPKLCGFRVHFRLVYFTSQ